MQSADAVLVKEDKNTVSKLSKKAVEAGVKMQQMKMKATPLMLKVASIFVPELAPVLLPLSKFFKSKAGKSWIDMTNKNYEAIGDLMTGEKEAAKDKFKENFDLLNSEDGTEIITSVKDVVEEVKGAVK